MTDPASDPGWSRLLTAARRSLERSGGSLDGMISLMDPSDAERRIVIGATGVHRSAAAARLAVRLADLDAYVVQLTGRRLAEVAAQASGTPLRNRPAERAYEALARDAAMSFAHDGAHAGEPWYSRWLDTISRDGTLTRIVRTGLDFPSVIRVLDALPAADEPLPAFADRLLDDTKGLGDTATRSLLLRAIATWQGLDMPASAGHERALWESVGVIPDDLASQVLVLNVRAHGGLVGGWLTQAADAGIPMRLTLHQLRLVPLAVESPAVFVTENPAILRAACTALGATAPAMICTEGVPSAAVHRLLRAVTAPLWVRNDFDWPGVRMTAAALSRYPQARPWRMTADDYRSAAESGQPLTGTPAQTPWDPPLGDAMVAAGRAVMEERLLPRLIDDLTRAAG